MTPILRTLLAGSLSAFALLASTLHGDAQVLITNWTSVQGNTSNLNTANPIFGTGTANSVTGSEVYANIGSHSLAIGDTLTFSGSVTMTGNQSSANNQFRIGLMYSNGSVNDTGMLGYWFGNSEASTVGTLRERNSPATAVDMMSTADTSAPSFATAGAVNFISIGTYAFSLSYQRASATSLAITWTLSNGGTYVLSKTFTDTTVVSGFTFDTVALFAGTVNATKYSYADVSYTVVPEPQTWGMLGFAGFAFVVIGRKKLSKAKA